ncbi:hypothetical protein EW026_g7893 [Hermanssonia centrifuga]|uniref:CCHC-type domain-containing protein n=1 Tax=Hermanssonia centrifuga TaxID=98765 RepID=A0A4S4KAM7_9APHY|nr:hypothetical protein EW026_g7893 [Hermanssonia centrifuga]
MAGRPRVNQAPTNGSPHPRRDGNNPRPRPAALSEKEKADLRAAGKCFICKEAGHLARNCPLATNTRSDRRGQPPGVSTFSMAIDFDKIDSLRLQADASDLEAIRCNLMGLDDAGDEEGPSGDDTESADAPILEINWARAYDRPDLELPRTRREGRPYIRLGDPYSEHASNVLTRHMPYCCGRALGDECYDMDPLVVYQISETHNVIMGRGLVPDLEVPRYLLDDAEFNLPQWYQARVAELLGHRSCGRRAIPGEELGDVLSLAAEAILLKYIPFPKAWVRYRDGKVDQRFYCHRSQDAPVVVVHDDYLFTRSEIPIECFANRSLDLPNLYATVIRRVLAEPVFSVDALNDELLELFGHNDPISTPIAGEFIELFTVHTSKTGTHQPIAAIQRNAASVKDFKRLIPDSIVVIVNINGQPARALIDSGSMADFLSTKIAHQLKLDIFELQKQLPVHWQYKGLAQKLAAEQRQSCTISQLRSLGTSI